LISLAERAGIARKALVREDMPMKYDFDAEEVLAVAEALKVYVSDLRAEITKTEKHEWVEALHKEEQLLNGVLTKLEGAQ
jgi:hypothetical protein